MFVNGDISGSSGGVGNFTVYVNPYLVVRSGEYSNHYFIEGHRVATRLVHGWNQQVTAPDAGDSISFDNKEKLLLQAMTRDQQTLQDSAEAAAVTGKDARSTAMAGSGSSGSGTPWANANPGNNGNQYAYGHYRKDRGRSSQTSPDFLYFYHPDHIGNTSYVTDGSGEVYEHLEYFTFGETFVEEHSNEGGPFGNGAPENGLYHANNLDERGPSAAARKRYNPGMNRDGVGFSLDLNPQLARVIPMSVMISWRNK